MLRLHFSTFYRSSYFPYISDTSARHLGYHTVQLILYTFALYYELALGIFSDNMVILVLF